METLFKDCIEYVEGICKEVLADTDAFVSVGGSTVGRACECLVREMPQSVQFSDRSTSAVGMGQSARGCYRVTFNVELNLWAKRPTLTVAAYDVQSWAERVFSAVACDKTLGGLCIHAEPYWQQSGTSIDANKLSIAAIDCGITIKAEINPAKSFS